MNKIHWFLLAWMGVIALQLPAAAQNREMQLRPSDRITVTIGGVPPEDVAQISKVYTIDDSGAINMVYINQVKAAGLKPSDLQRSIESIYKSKEIFSNPVVTVSIDDNMNVATTRTVTVTGVQLPGKKQFKPGMTTMDAITDGGGPTPFAKLKDTKVIRTMPSGERRTIPVDLGRYSRDPSVDIKLEPDDLVIVPE
jgi:polysaccharide export outer membrane protein